MRYIPILLLILAACSTVKHDQKALAKAYSRNKPVTDKWFNDFYGTATTGSSTTYVPGDSTGYLDWIATLNRELAALQEREPDTLWGYMHDTTTIERIKRVLASPPPPIRDTINRIDSFENKAAVLAANSSRDEAVTLAGKLSDRADKVTGQRNWWMIACIATWVLIAVYVYFKIRKK